MTWTVTGEFPFCYARPFIANDKIYVLGHNGDLMIMHSDDGGVIWSEPSLLTNGEQWHQSACNVWYKEDIMYLVMEMAT